MSKLNTRLRRTLQVVSGWEAVELIVHCVIFGAWQLLKIGFKRLWKGPRRKLSNSYPPVQVTVDSSIGTHCYIKILGVKYHYVETGPSDGEVILVLGDAPEASSTWGKPWASVVRKLADAGHRVVSLDLRGTGGSEGGTRANLTPPQAVEELYTLLEALGVSENNPVLIIGQGIGGMLTWYFVHCHGSMVSKFVVIDAPHPNLYWQYPLSSFCENALHFIQWPHLPERWLAEGELVGDQSNTSKTRWSSSRACDWSGALNYIRGAAWWRVSGARRAEPAALLVGARGSAAGAPQLVASAEHCAAPTLRLVQRAHASAPDLHPVLLDFIVGNDGTVELTNGGGGRGLMGRVLGAVAGRGRELTAAVSRARLVLPPAPAPPPPA